MKKQNKKGFTIVELVIVIAVIAILAAILVPVISNLIRRAHVTKDSELVRNLNTALAMDTTTDHHITMQSALEAAAKNGYDVALINASATDNMILWDSVNDVFCYRVVEDGVASIEYIPNSVKSEPLNADDYRLWIISDTVSDTYSTYYTGNAATINTKKGFDAGTTTTVTSVNYTGDTSAQNVVIRTNGGELTINAPDDTVNHYGNAVVIDVQAVAPTSYYEYGTVSFAKITTGRIVVTEKAEIGGIHISATESGENKVYQQVAVAVVGNAEIPTLTRDKVTEEDNDNYSILVVELQTLATEKTIANNTNTEKIWVIGVTEDETKTVSTIATDTSATSTNASTNAKAEETLSESAATLVSSESTVKESTDEEDAQNEAIMEVMPEGAFQLSYFTLTNAYNSKVIALNLINAPNDDVSKYKWEVSDSILSFNTTYDSNYNKYEIIRLNNVGKALITATLKSDTTKKAYLVVDIKADLNMDTSKNISMTGVFTKKSTNKISAKIPVKLYIEGCEDVETTKTVSADNSYFNNYRTEWSVTSGEENATLTPLTKETAQLAFIKSGSITIHYTVYDENENCREFDKTFTCSLTGVAEVTVDETTTKYYSFDEAWKAVKESGGTLTLLSNINVGSPSAYTVGAPASKYTLSENKEVILNLGEYTLSWSDEAVTGGAGNPSALFMFNVVKDATLTINATTGGIDTKGTNVETSYAVVLGSWSVNETYWEMWKGNVVINSGNFYGGNSVVHVYAGTATINGGHFELNTNAAAANSSPNYLVNVQDGSWSNNDITTVVSITGGEFVGFNPSDNPEGANTTYIASGYTATEISTGVWTVTANE